MPSGSKKRKAAKKKKKKEEEANSATNNFLHGDDDRKVHDKKESDRGETNSPLLQDRHNNQHFVEGKEKTEEDTLSVQSAIAESEYVEGVNGNGKISDEVAVKEKNGIQIDREIKLEGASAPEAVTIEHIELGKKFSSSSSSSSSSDEESKFGNKNIEVVDWEEPIERAPNFPPEAAAVVDLEKTSNLPEVIQDIVSPIVAMVTPNEESYEVVSQVTKVNDVVSPILAAVTPNEESYEVVSAGDPSSVSVKPADFSEINNVTEAVPVVDDHDFVVAKSKAEVSDLVSDTMPQSEPVILSKEKVRLDEGLGLEINGKSESSGFSSSVFDTGSQSKVDTISSRVTEDGELISTTIVEEDESKPQPQSSVAAADMVNGMNTVSGTEHKKDSETESLDKPTPIALPRRPVQNTSSMGCCGLFELFTGLNR